MPKIGRKKAISVTLPPEMISEVERVAKKRNMAKAAVYQMMIDLGLDVHRDMERVGIIPMVDFAHYVKTTVREKLEKTGRGKQMELL